MTDPRQPFVDRLGEITGFDVPLDWGGLLIDELIELAVQARRAQRGGVEANGGTCGTPP